MDLSIFLKAEAPPAAQLNPILKPFGFKNPLKVWKEFAAFGQEPFDRISWVELLPLLLVEFSKAPDPDLAANHFATFASLAFHKNQLFPYLLKAPAARQMLARGFGVTPAPASARFPAP